MDQLQFLAALMIEVFDELKLFMGSFECEYETYNIIKYIELMYVHEWIFEN